MLEGISRFFIYLSVTGTVYKHTVDDNRECGPMGKIGTGYTTTVLIFISFSTNLVFFSVGPTFFFINFFIIIT